MIKLLSVQNLTKYFGSFKALDAISFSIQKGKIVGLLGPNGAGKTTTIRIIIGILPKTSGTIRINEQILDPKSRAWKSQFGVVPEVSNAYLDYSPLKNLIFSGRLYGLSKQYCESSALELLEAFGLSDKKNTPTKKLSKGQRQRLNFSMALMHNPEILFLDEPLAGLDVNSARQVKNRINKLRNKGKTIFLTTHNMREANVLCDEIIILNRGKIVAIGSPKELRKNFLPASTIDLELEKSPTDPSLFKPLNIDYQIDTANKTIKFFSTNPVEDFSRIQNFLSVTPIKITQLKISPASLEEIFLKILGET